MKLRLLKIGLAIVIAFGFFWLYKTIFLDIALDNVNPLNIDNIGSQIFRINNNRDTVLLGKQGTLIAIRKNSFNDCKGNQILDLIDIHLKEIYTKEDIVYSGLSTTSDKAMLETDGMLWINVYHNEIPLCLNDSSTITLITPTDSLDKRMKQFYGKIIDGSVNWENPEEMVSSEDKIISIYEMAPWNQDETTLVEAIKSGIIGSDTTAIYNDRFDKSYYNSIIAAYDLDSRINNILEVSELGWLNIDRFVESFETQKVDFSIVISNRKAYPSVFTKLIFKDLNSVLSGYEIGSSKIVFGKSNDEKVNLPIGAKAIVLISGHVNKEPYYYLEEITIKESQNIQAVLRKTSEKELIELVDSQF